MTFDGVGRDHGATGVPAPSRQVRTPAAGERRRGHADKFLERVSAGEDARRSIDKGESTRE